jgi:hypothetical protein
MIIRSVVYGDPVRRQAGGGEVKTFRFRGCQRLDTLRKLLRKIDEGGYERSDHQLTFHAAFERCVARVLYKGEWTTQRVAIMKTNSWTKSSSEVMVSTPRRFGKTFRCFENTPTPAALAFADACRSSAPSIAMFVAAMALSVKCDIVIFSPARRASRKLLERVVEFINVLGEEKNITECERPRAVPDQRAPRSRRSFHAAPQTTRRSAA